MKTTIGFLQEKEGVNSINRVIFMAGSLLTFLLVIYYATVRDASALDIVALFAGMQGTLGVMKLGQKAIEKKNDA